MASTTFPGFDASSEPTSGLSFAGPTGTNDTYVILQSKATISSLKLRNEDGREGPTVYEPLFVSKSGTY